MRNFRLAYSGWLVVVLALLVAPTLAESLVASGHQQVARELGHFGTLAEKLKPAVVSLQVAAPATGFREAFRARGSGVLLTHDGYILTNHHVIDRATEIKVQVRGVGMFWGTLVGSDPATDLAVVKITSSGLPFAKLGDSDEIRPGHWVMAIGSPFGLESTVTVGVLSGKGRRLGGALDSYLQTDAPINPGNSGGPLFNLAGEVVGINTARLVNAEAIGFAVPSNIAKSVYQQLVNKGRVSRGYLGVSLRTLSSYVLQQEGLPGNLQGGVLIEEVSTNSPAAQAGLRTGDIVVAFGGKPTLEAEQLVEAVVGAEADSRKMLSVYRSGQLLGFEVRLGQRR